MLHKVKEVHKIQVIRFLLAGVFCAGVEFVLFWLLVHLYHVPYLHANMGSLLVAVVLNYFISRKVVFEKGRYSGKLEFTAFLVFSAMGVALNQFLIWYFVEQAGVEVNLGKVLAIGLAAVFNYFTKKHIVFKK
jgi:putative flippase GtrA